MEPGAQEAAARIEDMIVASALLWRESCEATAAFEDARFALMRDEARVMHDFATKINQDDFVKAHVYTAWWDSPEYLDHQARVRAATVRTNEASEALAVARQRLLLAQNVFAATYVGTSRLDGGQV